MIPLRDNVRPGSRPVITWVLIGVNIAVFAYEWTLGAGANDLVWNLGLVPGRFLDHAGTPAAWVPVLTSMFLHGSWLHVLGNMLFLHVFGDNVEDRLGKPLYVGFYLLAGLAAAATQVAFSPDARVPMVGASGAVAGVIGAYIVILPRARVLTLVPLPPFLRLMELPAYVVLGLWFVLQLGSGLLELGAGAGGGGGVAVWAHVGGFVAGLAVGALLRTVAPKDDSELEYRPPPGGRFGVPGPRAPGGGPWG